MLAESKNQTNNKLVRVICPICKADKEINIPIEIIKQTPALTTISIPNGLICQHHFQMFVDKNYKVRGYQKVDFQFETKRPDDNKENTIKHDKNQKSDEKIIKNLIFEGNYVEYKPENMKIQNPLKQEIEVIDPIKNDKIIEVKKEIITKKEDVGFIEKSLEEIYEEFWEFIEDDNVEFQEFIIKDKRRLQR